jgi:hypothetical protein
MGIDLWVMDSQIAQEGSKLGSVRIFVRLGGRSMLVVEIAAIGNACYPKCKDV